MSSPRRISLGSGVTIEFAANISDSTIAKFLAGAEKIMAAEAQRKEAGARDEAYGEKGEDEDEEEEEEKEEEEDIQDGAAEDPIATEPAEKIMLTIHDDPDMLRDLIRDNIEVVNYIPAGYTAGDRCTLGYARLCEPCLDARFKPGSRATLIRFLDARVGTPILTLKRMADDERFKVHRHKKRKTG